MVLGSLLSISMDGPPLRCALVSHQQTPLQCWLGRLQGPAGGQAGSQIVATRLPSHELLGRQADRRQAGSASQVRGRWMEGTHMMQAN